MCTRRARERTIDPGKRMHVITIKHSKEQVYVHVAEANYLGHVRDLGVKINSLRAERQGEDQEFKG